MGFIIGMIAGILCAYLGMPWWGAGLVFGIVWGVIGEFNADTKAIDKFDKELGEIEDEEYKKAYRKKAKKKFNKKKK